MSASATRSFRFNSSTSCVAQGCVTCAMALRKVVWILSVVPSRVSPQNQRYTPRNTVGVWSDSMSLLQLTLSF